MLAKSDIDDNSVNLGQIILGVGFYLAQSVKKYFQEMYEDDIFEAVNDHIHEHPEELKEKFRRLHRMGELQLDSVDVKVVYTKRHPHNMLEFEIATEASIECCEGDYHYDDERETMVWFSVFGTGSMDNLLDDFNITLVKPYIRGKHCSRNALKDTFVPDIQKENLDDVAEKFLAKYYPVALRTPMPIDTDALLKNLNLTKIEHRISADASVFGQIYFEDVESQLYDEDSERPETISVKAGTILVDPMVFFLRNVGSVKNTIIHECVHWLFHKPVFVLEKISNSSLTKIDCAMVGGIRGQKWSVAEQVEWQANALTPRIQMPKSTFKQKANELIAELLEEKETDSVLDVIEPVIERLATFFEVSKLSAKIRMVELGYEEARGAFIYLDGYYVLPHACKPGFLKMHQTFSVGLLDVRQLAFNDHVFRDDLRCREFVYVDSHFVYNRPKYVRHTEFGLEITSYALEHMDECCLVFDLDAELGCGEDYKSLCFLNRAEDSRITFTPHYASGLEAAGKEKQEKAEREEMNEAYTLLKSLPGDYAAALTQLVESSDMTVEEIADETGVSAKTIKGMMKGQNRGSYGSLAYVCLSLQLHPAVSQYLIDRSPWKFNFKDKMDMALQEALGHFYGHKMAYIHAKVASLSAE